jgi:putative peptidoglycan lipid II flippase
MPEGTLATFGYAWKLLLLAGILPSGLATVIFPAFSDAQANENPTEWSRLVMRAFRMTLLLTIPLTTVLFVERIPLISLMFERGAMGIEALTETGQLFGILLVGAPAGTLSAVLLKVALSMQDTKTPMIVALLSAMAITWSVPYAAAIGGAKGVAWAFNAVTWGGTLVMLGYQIARYRIMRVSDAIQYSGHLTVLCTGIALPIVAIRSAFELNALASRSMMLLEITLVGFVFFVSGYGLSRLLRVHESSEIWRYLRWQMGRFA